MYCIAKMANAVQRPDLQALAAQAQAALRVRDWQIEIAYVPDLEMGGGAVWGTCSTVPDTRKAWIAVRDPMTPPPGSTPEEALAEVAKTVIHEVAHLLFVPFANSTPAEIMAEENAVWAFSEVLEQVLIPQMTTAAPVARWADAPAPMHARTVGGAAPTETKPKIVPTARPAGKEKKKMAGMTLETMGLLVKTLKLDPAATTVDDIYKALGVSPAGESSEDAAPPEPMPAAKVDPAAPADPAKDPEADAAKARVIAITGKASVGEAARIIESWKKDSAELADLKARTVANQAALDKSERHALVARLVSECGESPATAWKDPLAKDLEPGPAWAAVDLDTLRARVATLSKAPKARGDVKPPVEGTDAHGLTERELSICAEMKCDPKDFAALKARRATAN